MLRAAGSTEKVDLIPLSETMWRVCDTRFETGGLQILGYLQSTDDDYKMVWMRPRIGITRTFPTMESALRAIYASLD